MSDFDYKEIRFEEDIETFLIESAGYVKGNSQDFDRALALDTKSFVHFIQNSQPKEWEKFVKIYGEKSEKQIVDRFCREVSLVGLLKILRSGFTDRGIRFRALFWKAETSLNEQTKTQFEQNTFVCTRQLHYSPKNENSIDIVLFINGIPLVSMELKCQFTGQDTKNAINQYKFDRAGKEALFEFNRRVLVHFAVDLTEVYMTTKLQGGATYFLPFNQGSNGAGNVGGSGNKENPNGYKTAYLWEEVLQKERLLEILQKYLHLEVKKDKKNAKIKPSETMIFPRYHQLDVVTKLLSDVKQNGSGNNYLIQHSAGSGKSNSIAWLSHRLCSLHNADDELIFNSVIVVTDRKVLDNQLQDTIYQFDHVDGVVQKIKKSSELKDAINSGAKIIITTLQKFPVIFKAVESENKRFAIIIDEAHSSQTGAAAHKLKYALADTDKILEEYAQNEYEDEKNRKDDEDKMLEELASHGHHENLSFFAFTATPKDKTLQAFGNLKTDGKYYSYHVYSMKQAIEEGFILDVLNNYMTYNMYFKIAKSIPDDPTLDTIAGLKAIRNYESLHPHNIAQKTSIMLAHFNNVTKYKLDGSAKAMIVTPSRLHAVRYLHEFRTQIKDKGFDNLNVLVAFSGEVHDKNTTYTEEKLNKTLDGQTIKEKQLPEAFNSDDFGMLIVAEKYQTGFDEPLLHTMFVDKKLSGVKAVQTLSRLNRTTRGKHDTFILDFVNTADDIKKSFEPFYTQTVLEAETDPNVVNDIKRTLDEYRVYNQHEVESFSKIYFAPTIQKAGDLGRLSATLNPAIDRYIALEDELKDTFRTGLARFCRIYSFITQVCRMFDKDLHKFSVYAKFLLKMLPKDTNEKIYVDDKVFLEYYKLEKAFDGSIELAEPEAGFTPITGESGKKEKKLDKLTAIINTINERFGTHFKDMDKVLKQIQNDFMEDGNWKSYAQNNDPKTFMLLFEKSFPDIAAHRYEKNDDFFVQLFNNSEMMSEVMENLGRIIYEKLRAG